MAPEKLLRALLLQAFYSIRSERQLMEQLDFNLLFRWFVGLGMDDPVWDAKVFCKNRERLLEAEVAAKLWAGVVEHPSVSGLLSREHFSVDGTLIEAWASMKSSRPKDGGDDGPGRLALPQGARQGEQTLLHGSRADRESQRSGSRWRAEPGSPATGEPADASVRPGGCSRASQRRGISCVVAPIPNNAFFLSSRFSSICSASASLWLRASARRTLTSRGSVR